MSIKQISLYLPVGASTKLQQAPPVKPVVGYGRQTYAYVTKTTTVPSSRTASIKLTTQRHLDYLDHWRLNLAHLDYLIKTTDGTKRYRNAPDPVNEIVISF